MDPSSEQRLVGVDVAHARDDPLVEDQRLDGGGPTGDGAVEVVNGEARRERLGAELGLERARVGCWTVGDAAELALVREAEVAAVVQQEP
jgi:hypothetical protein